MHNGEKFECVMCGKSYIKRTGFGSILRKSINGNFILLKKNPLQPTVRQNAFCLCRYCLEIRTIHTAWEMKTELGAMHSLNGYLHQHLDTQNIKSGSSE